MQESLSHVKLKSLEVLFIKNYQNLGLQEFKYFWKINHNRSTLAGWIDS
jgi:hypothetical protein